MIGAGADETVARLASFLPLSPSTDSETMAEHVRSARSRGLSEVQVCRPHRHFLTIAGGGPSLEDTYKSLTGYVAAMNGSLAFLLDKGVVPSACGIVDPGAHIADMIVADRRIRYYVASVCHPRVFDKLRGHEVRLWHPSPHVRAELIIGGGCTMGLRWFNLGYVLGFRRFHAHGLDSSFRKNLTHAYPDRADSKDRLLVNGRETRANFVAQVADFGLMLERWSKSDTDAVEIEIYGNGLLQDTWHRARALTPSLFKAQPVTVACVNAGNYCGRGREYVMRLHAQVARHASLPFRFICFTDDPFEGVECRPLPQKLPGWWNKLGLFTPRTFGSDERVVYLDLDTEIVGDIDWLLRYRGPFAMLGSFFDNVNAPFAGPQSGVMAWQGDGPDIWNEYVKAGFPQRPGGDQAFINSLGIEPDLLQDLYPRFIVSYKGHCRDGVPKDASVVCFHGAPRPHEVHWNVAADNPQ